MHRVQIRVDEVFLEGCGSSSLLGTIAVGLEKDQSILDVEKVELVFPLTSIGYRRQHGPRCWVMPEYTLMCLINDILALKEKGIEVTCVEETWNPKEGN